MLPALVPDDEGLDRLPEDVIRNADHGRLGHPFHLAQGVLDFLGAHALALGLDHVVLARHEIEKALRIPFEKVPAVEQGLPPASAPA